MRWKESGRYDGPAPTTSVIRFCDRSLVSAGLAVFACLAAVFAAFLPEGGHPPLSDYVAAIAIPIAWLFAVAGVAFAVSSRHSVSRPRYRLALVANIGAVLAGIAIWFVWPLLRSP